METVLLNKRELIDNYTGFDEYVEEYKDIDLFQVTKANDGLGSASRVIDNQGEVVWDYQKSAIR